MPAKSKSQARLFGMVHAYQSGKLKSPPDKIKSVAGGISPEAVKDFASTKHKGLPERKKAKTASSKAAGRGGLSSVLAHGGTLAVSTLPSVLPADRLGREALKFSSFLLTIARNVPAGQKAAEVRVRLRSVDRLEKLAAAMLVHGNLITAVAHVFPEKSAVEKHGLINRLISAYRRNPGLQDMLGGAALGAGMGGLAGAGFTYMQPKKKRRLLRNMLWGAGLGGATGAASTYLPFNLG